MMDFDVLNDTVKPSHDIPLAPSGLCPYGKYEPLLTRTCQNGE